MLNDHEERVLVDIEHALASTDPALAAQMRGHRHGRLRRGLGVLASVLIGVPVGAVTGRVFTAVLGVSVLSAELLVAPALLLVMGAGMLWIMTLLERAASDT